MKSIAIIIPAYKEIENLKILIPRIRNLYPLYDIVVVDDSPDGEQKELEAFIRNDSSRVHIVHRSRKSGRGSAVIEGMRFASTTLQTSLYIEMDADLAHDPEEIDELVFETDHADLVIGSRYMAGSKIIKWPKRRLIQSRIINFVLRYWLRLPLSDFTNGFRAYSGKAVNILLTHTLYEKGYIALSESAYLLQKNGCVITEVPVSFTDRTLGSSNATVGELMRSLIGALRIPFRV